MNRYDAKFFLGGHGPLATPMLARGLILKLSPFGDFGRYGIMPPKQKL